MFDGTAPADETASRTNPRAAEQTFELRIRILPVRARRALA
jgi:hypothetical protein